MSAYEGLITRSSVRDFSKDPVNDELIKKIAEAGLRAASANNVQPFLFVAVKDAQKRKDIKDMCPKNGPYIEFAPVCMVVFCRRDVKYYLEDGCAATQNIVNAAHMLGLGAVWVAGAKKDYADKIRDYVNVSDEYELISLIPIGYPKEKTPLTPKKPIDEVFRWE